jgi:dienelactone hydrolase
MSCLLKSEWKCVETIAMEDLNMHLVGAGGGSGTARMDFIDEYTVDVHGCKKGDEFTRYERFDLRDVTNSRTIAQAIDSDITGFLRNPNTNSIDAVIYESDRIRILPLVSPEDDNCYERLENAFQSQLITHASEKTILPSFYPVSRTSDNKIWVVYAYADKGNTICDNCPEAYFIFKNEATTREHLSLWKVRRPLLKTFYGSLGTQHTLHVKSRDGKTLLCFLTLPPPNIINDDELLPLVVFPHGGPNWRDQWGYNPMLQALATQGYVVLQVEFRGSTGFGMKFMKDGMQGGCCSSTQCDIVDSVHFVLDNIVIYQPENQQAYIKINNENCNDANGIRCDPNRVAILGGSFGGYCALFGVTLLDSAQPKFQYCCGVAFAALYSVGAAGTESFRGDPLVKSYQRKLYGQKISDELDAARAVSPFFHVDKVNVPLMISHGENDPRCPINLANIFCGKLSERGLVRYITYKDEGHGLRKEGNIVQNWKEVLKFLRERLGKPNSVINHQTSDNEQAHSGKIIYYEN